jgi:hypothetical protein
MQQQLLLMLVTILVFALSLFTVTQAFPLNMGGGKGIMDFRSSSGPTLLYPATDDIKLGGKDFLEFRWERTELSFTDHYEFRLYKGRETIDQALILNKDILVSDFPIKVTSVTFEDGQVYTWSLRQVFVGGTKGDTKFSAFKTSKK